MLRSTDSSTLVYPDIQWRIDVTLLLFRLEGKKERRKKMSVSFVVLSLKPPPQIKKKSDLTSLSNKKVRVHNVIRNNLKSEKYKKYLLYCNNSHFNYFFYNERSATSKKSPNSLQTRPQSRTNSLRRRHQDAPSSQKANA